jgi:DNA invertase Pin-like site-specific DNA recombinase
VVRVEKRIYGYARVSSKDQNEERQLKAFEELGINERDIFIDKQSGKDFENREQYQMLKRMLRENDLLIIKSIDRLGRNYNMIIAEWRDITTNIKADIKVIDMPMLDTTKHKDLLGAFISDLILQILSYVAEQERTFIKQRQKEGIIVAKSKGIRLGRPKISKPSNFDYIADKWRNNEMTTKEALNELNLRPNTFYNFIKLVD